jgi:hypothetical protein
MKNKKLITFIAATIFTATLFSCKKENSPPTKTELLCGKTFKKWKVIGYQRAYNTPVTSSTPDILNTIPSTYRDNILIFYPNGVEKLNEGPTGPNPNVDYDTKAWVFTDNETVMNCTILFGILSTADSQLNLKILELSDQKMVLDNEFLFNPTSYYNRWTLVPTN